MDETGRLRRASLGVLLLVGLGWSGVVRGEEVTVTYTAQLAALGNAGGGDLAAGSLVRFGLIDASPDEVRDHANDFAFLTPRFRELSATRVGMFDGEGFGVDGVFGLSVSFDSKALVFEGFENGLVGARPYLWAFNAPTLELATEHGIFSSAAWAIPEIATETYELDQVSPLEAADVYIGSLQPGGSSILPGADLHRLVTIPEPGVGGLLCLALGGFLLRRRRAVGGACRKLGEAG